MQRSKEKPTGSAVIHAIAALFILAMGQALANNAADTFTNAVAFHGETQEDAPALEIYLTRVPHPDITEPARPYLHIEVAGRNWDALIGKDIELVPLSRHDMDPSKPIVRAELNLERQKPTWLKGTLRLKKVEVGQRVEGTYDFIDPTDRHWAGSFEAPWIDPKNLR
jgi:hypothetical protein